MRRYRRPFLALLALVFAAPLLTDAQRTLDPISYTLRFPEPASKTFTVEIKVPSDKRATVDLMMPIWSPGFYGLQNYADRVSNVEAHAADGTALGVTRSSASRWTVAAGGGGGVLPTPPPPPPP